MMYDSAVCHGSRRPVAGRLAHPHGASGVGTHGLSVGRTVVVLIRVALDEVLSAMEILVDPVGKVILAVRMEGSWGIPVLSWFLVVGANHQKVVHQHDPHGRPSEDNA